MKKLIVILGPTASGKSSYAIYLAKLYNGVIISADSRQIYKEMNIGTAKPNRIEQKGIKHFLINHIKPNESYSLANFQNDVHKTINDLPDSKLPFLVGGTGLYISSIVDGYFIPRVKPNKILRRKLEQKTTKQLSAYLKRLAPRSTHSIDLNNRRYLIRAIEIAKDAHIDVVKKKKRDNSLYDVLQIGIQINRDELYKKINDRVDQMIKRGLVAEVKKLSQKYSWDLPAMSGIGYKQIGQYLRGEISKDKAVELIKRDTRHYAKRQLTWFRKDKSICWVNNQQQAQALIKNHLK
ncbi:tRNA (adenosine(37)-N6)-dimethylallyltransferase MiaA [Patescibacteria group bacterium]|nr:tRNA (adenosine(37)-N6)-dimethylallyltransferase MiaA [Patescibacteria group bacterium]MBU1890725.1 tRNA (adenosine(37)-N6)-dimethylallyltransferase MiaA [Patescibacteria group bacterium]